MTTATQVQNPPLGSGRQPSLLRQIIDEVDDMDNEKKEDLLFQIKMSKALELAQQADELFQDKFRDLSDDEISDTVSKNRKLEYEAKVHH